MVSSQSHIWFVIFNGWGISVDCTALAPNNSYGEPKFVRRRYYIDKRFTCAKCGTEEVWTAAQQKWWNEVV